MYDDAVEDKLFQFMIDLIDRRLSGREGDKESEKFRRMPQDGGKVIVYGQRLV